MKTVFRLFVFITLGFSFATLAFADYGFKVDSIEGDAVHLSWDDSDAMFFQVEYGPESAESGGYEFDSILLDDPEYIAKELTVGNTYYFRVSGVDDSGEPVFESSELEVVVKTKPVVVNDFSLDDVSQTGEDEINLVFSNAVSTTQDPYDRQFKIESVKDTTEYFNVLTSVIDDDNPKSMTLTLDGVPLKGEQYKVVVLSLEDISGNTMEFGVDSENAFIGGYEEDLNAGGLPEDEEKEESKSIPKAPKDTGPSGQDVDTESLNKDVHSASEKKEDLPQTGPEHVLLFFVALILSALFFIPRYIKN